MALSLTIAHFKRVIVYAKAVAIGLGCQMLILPAVCLGIAELFGLRPELAVGLMLLAASSGGAIGEFIGDLISFVQTKSPLLGLGFFKDGAPARDLEDPNYRCYDPKKREGHAAGHLLGAVVWDIHQDLEAAGVTGERLKRLMLLPIAAAQTRAQWYAAMLAVDDDDGNLANGTPNECLIYNQFKAHSCAGTRWPGIPADDPPYCRK